MVIGAGSSGAVVASRLAEIKEWKVLLLEGGDYPLDCGRIPAMSGAMRASRYIWEYISEPETTSCLGEIENNVR